MDILEYKNSVILAHAGQQSSFKRAVALNKGNLLLKYITTVYLKDRNKWIIKVLKAVSASEANRLLGRNCGEINDLQVMQIDVIPNLLLVFINRVPKLSKLYQASNRVLSTRFARRVARYAEKARARMLIMMGNAPAAAFDYLERNDSKVIKVFDMTSVAYNYQSKVMKKEMERLPKRWKGYVIVPDDLKEISRLMNNIYKADYIIVSSNFAKQTLLDNKIDEKKIRVINYGFDNINAYKTRENIVNRPIKLLYVGSVSFEKGLHYLFKAMEDFSSDEIELTVVGKSYLPVEMVDRYQNKIKFVGDVPHGKIHNYYHAADLFITPSLFDSFGNVVTEALSYGLPVICTNAVGAADYVIDKYNGLIIAPGDVDEIINALRYFLCHRNCFHDFSRHAYQTAKQHTWEEYSNSYIKVITEILERERD